MREREKKRKARNRRGESKQGNEGMGRKKVSSFRASRSRYEPEEDDK